MWPSLSTANSVADWANIFFIGSLVVGVVATTLIVWMSGVKERYWEKDRAEAASRIAELSTQALELGKQTAEAKSETAKAQLATEELRKRNLELLEAVAPRILEINAPAAALTQYAGSEVAVFTIPEYEARRLAGSLLFVFEKAEWKQPILRGFDENALDGVTILYVKQRPPPQSTEPLPDPSDPTYQERVMRPVNEIRRADAITELRRLKAEAIAAQLSVAKIAVRVQLVPSTRLNEFRWPQGFSEDGIVVRVGLKPSMYFVEQKFPEIREFRENLEKNEREIREKSEQVRQKLQESLPPTRPPSSVDNK